MTVQKLAKAAMAAETAHRPALAARLFTAASQRALNPRQAFALSERAYEAALAA